MSLLFYYVNRNGGKLTYMEMRKLKASDIGLITKIIGGIGVKEFSSIFNNDAIADAVKKGKGVAENVGAVMILNVVGIVCDNYTKVETDIFKLLSSLTGEKVETLKDLAPSEFMELIVEVVNKEEFKDFFTVALKLIK